jgi:hypothetical protein
MLGAHSNYLILNLLFEGLKPEGEKVLVLKQSSNSDELQDYCGHCPVLAAHDLHASISVRKLSEAWRISFGRSSGKDTGYVCHLALRAHVLVVQSTGQEPVCITISMQYRPNEWMPRSDHVRYATSAASPSPCFRIATATCHTRQSYVFIYDPMWKVSRRF